MAQINQYLSIATERTGSFAISRSPWRTQRRPLASHNTHFRYQAVTRDPIVRTDTPVAPRGAR